MAHGSETRYFDFDAELVLSMPQALRIIRSQIKNPNDANDAFQSALVRALEHRNDYVNKGKMASWLATIAINIFISDKRTAERRRKALENVVMHETETYGHIPVSTSLEVLETTEEAQEVYERSALIRRHFGSLSSDHKEALRARLEFEGYGLTGRRNNTHQNAIAAKNLGIPAGTFKSRANRGMERLRVTVYTELVGHMVDEITRGDLEQPSGAIPRDEKE